MQHSDGHTGGNDITSAAQPRSAGFGNGIVEEGDASLIFDFTERACALQVYTD